MGFGDYLIGEILDHVFGCGTRDYTSPTNIYVALSTADPTSDGSGMTEPSGGSYARSQTTGDDWSVAAAGAISNSDAISFPESTDSWGTITHFGLFDAAADGNYLGGGALTSGQEIASGKIARFAIGSLDVSLT